MIEKYKEFWLAFAQIKPEPNRIFSDLIEVDADLKENYVGAWANLLIRAETINEALEVVPAGLAEKGFEVVFIDKIENLQSLVEYEEIDQGVLHEVDWLMTTDYVFLISDKIFPYVE